MNRLSRQAGFTLLEIMLVVAIIAMLVGGAIYLIAPTLDQAKDAKVDADLQTLKTLLLMYESANGAPPTTDQGLRALVDKPSSEPVPPHWRHLADQVPLDPWQRPYQYENPGTHNSGAYDLYSMGKDGRAGTADDRGNWTPSN